MATVVTVVVAVFVASEQFRLEGRLERGVEVPILYTACITAGIGFVQRIGYPQGGFLGLVEAQGVVAHISIVQLDIVGDVNVIRVLLMGGRLRISAFKVGQYGLACGYLLQGEDVWLGLSVESEGDGGRTLFRIGVCRIIEVEYVQTVFYFSVNGLPATGEVVRDKGTPACTGGYLSCPFNACRA